jgi:hypothetical protein
MEERTEFQKQVEACIDNKKCKCSNCGRGSFHGEAIFSSLISLTCKNCYVVTLVNWTMYEDSKTQNPSNN